jgi:5-methylcytosine-specific restriction endonuclease McrA
VDKGKGREVKPEWHKLYGSKWRRESKAWLSMGRNGIAVDLFGTHRGRVVKAELVDHIIPHKGNRSLFWDRSNWQGLTKRDHDRKTALEQAGRWHPADMRELPDLDVATG